MPSETMSIEDAPIDRWLEALATPPENDIEFVDARDLPPPEPLTTTLELLPKLDDDVTLVQLNDRTPQFLYPKLDDRGYTYETIEVEAGVVTGIWQ